MSHHIKNTYHDLRGRHMNTDYTNLKIPTEHQTEFFFSKCTKLALKACTGDSKKTKTKFNRKITKKREFDAFHEIEKES